MKEELAACDILYNEIEFVICLESVRQLDNKWAL
jgi:hypothetical protein